MLSVITSCTSVNEITFPKEETLKANTMPLYGLTYPFRIEAKHPFLIVQNMPTLNDSLFHIYDLTNGELKSVFGNIGQGPKEFTLPWIVHSCLPQLVVLDEHRFYKYSIKKEGEVSLDNIIDPLYVNDLIYASFINDSLFIVDAEYTGPYLHLCSMKNEIPQKSWKYRNPNIMDYYMDFNKGQGYANEKRIIFCYKVKKQIDFMDTEFNLIKRVKFNDYDEPAAIGVAPGEDKESYIYAYLGKKYLYALFMGTTWTEHDKRLSCGYSLEVYDLDGNPIARYKLEGRRPVYYAVDEETFTLYGAGYRGVPEDSLLVYKLNGLK